MEKVYYFLFGHNIIKVVKVTFTNQPIYQSTYQPTNHTTTQSTHLSTKSVEWMQAYLINDHALLLPTNWPTKQPTNLQIYSPIPPYVYDIDKYWI